MNIQKVYEALGGSYEEVLQYFGGNEKLVKTFASKFIKDTSYDDLKNGLEEDDVNKAFMGAHTLKGVCANLCFSTLQKEASSITELLRNKELDEAKAYYPKVKEAYENTINALKQLEQ